MPANIRFGLYKTRDDVRLENKFTAVPLTMPLYENMEGAYTGVRKVSKKLREGFALIYSTYINTKLINCLAPRILP